MNTLGLFFLNLFFYALFLLFTLLVTPPVALVLVLLRPFSTHRVTMKRLHGAIRWYASIMVRLPYPWIRVRFEDQREGVKDGPFIFVSNHRSSSDPFLMSCLPGENVSVMKKWPRSIPILGPVSRLAEFPCDEILGAEGLMSKGKELLDQGISIIFFPEGTRTRTGKMGPFHSGAFKLALVARVPVVPVCLYGNPRVPAPGSMILHPGTVGLRVLPAVTWEEVKEMSAFQLKNKVRDILLSELESLEGK